MRDVEAVADDGSAATEDHDSSALTDQGAVALSALQRARLAADARGERRRPTRPPKRQRLDSVEDSDEPAGSVDHTDEESDPANLSTPAVLAGVSRVSQRSGTRWGKAPGMAATRTRWNEPRNLGAVIGRVSRQRGWDGPTAMGSVLAKWPMIVGEQVAEHCTIETFEGHKLVVRASSTAWAKQLQLLLPHIERRIEEEVGPGTVEQVIVRGPAAPSWKKGRLSVPGRGPRDTYG